MQQQNYSFLSTGRPTYWPSDPAKRPDLLDFFVTYGISSTYLDIEPSYDLSSDHYPIIATISTSPIHAPPIPRLHNSRTNWCTYRAKLQEAIKINKSLKNSDDVEAATHDLICLLQEVARQATPQKSTNKPPQTSHWKLKSYWPKNAKHELNGKAAMPPLIK